MKCIQDLTQKNTEGGRKEDIIALAASEIIVITKKVIQRPDQKKIEKSIIEDRFRKIFINDPIR